MWWLCERGNKIREERNRSPTPCWNLASKKEHDFILQRIVCSLYPICITHIPTLLLHYSSCMLQCRLKKYVFLLLSVLSNSASVRWGNYIEVVLILVQLLVLAFLKPDTLFFLQASQLPSCTQKRLCFLWCCCCWSLTDCVCVCGQV